MGAPGCVYIDGSFASPDEAFVPALDRGLLYGDGAFETLRTYGGVPFRLREHLVRLADGCAQLGIQGLPAGEALEARARETLARSKLAEATLRLTVTRGDGVGLAPPEGPPRLVVSALPLPPPREGPGARAIYLWRRAPDELPGPGVKSTSYQRSVTGRALARRRGADEGLFLDWQGNVAEGTTCNVFAWLDGELVTPPRTVCLPGITRAEVLSVAVELGLPVSEGPLPPAALERASEAFVTSSLAELVPLLAVEGRPIGGGAPGPLWARLLAGYQRRTASHAG